MAADVLFELFKFIGSFGAGVAAATIANRRSEREKAIDDVLQAIREFAERGERYWSTAASNPDRPFMEQKLRSLSRRVGILCGQLHHRHRLTCGPVDVDAIIGLRKAVTGAPFEEQHQDAIPGRVAEVSNAADDLIQAVRSARKGLFGISWLR